MGSDVTGYARSAPTVLAPASVREVRQIVRDARRTGLPIHPVSTGMNWGYGSMSPPLPGCTVVHLGRMNRIRNADEIDVDNPVALIEPGVTQRQLHEFLLAKAPSLMFNVTGAAADTSILGNALDGGVGYLSPRRTDIFGLEVVLGTGKILRTGFRRLGRHSRLAGSHPYGLGPALDGLFVQGNLGVVTSAYFKLRPRPPVQVALSLSLTRAEGLAPFVDALMALKREGVLPTITHVGNRHRTHATLVHGVVDYLVGRCGFTAARAAAEAGRVVAHFAPTEWSGLASVGGTAAQVKAAVSEVRRRLAGLARVTTVTDRRLSLAHAVADRCRAVPLARALAAVTATVRPLHGLALGVPTDAPVLGLLHAIDRHDLPATSLDESRCGLIYICPALPCHGADVAALLGRMAQRARGHGHDLHVTVNVETDTSMVAVTNLLFDRSDAEQVARAHRCADALLAEIHGAGLEVYRARSDMMADVVGRHSAHWGHVRNLKQVFDPQNIISPGRYNLPA